MPLNSVGESLAIGRSKQRSNVVVIENVQSGAADISPERMVVGFWRFLVPQDPRIANDAKGFSKIIGADRDGNDVCMVFTEGNASVARRAAEVYRALRPLKSVEKNPPVFIVGNNGDAVARELSLNGVPERVMVRASAENTAESIESARRMFLKMDFFPKRLFLIADPPRTRRYAAMLESSMVEVIPCPPQGDAITTTGLMPTPLARRMAEELLYLRSFALQEWIKPVDIPEHLLAFVETLGVTIPFIEVRNRQTYLPGELKAFVAK